MSYRKDFEQEITNIIGFEKSKLDTNRVKMYSHNSNSGRTNGKGSRLEGHISGNQMSLRYIYRKNEIIKSSSVAIQSTSRSSQVSIIVHTG